MSTHPPGGRPFPASSDKSSSRYSDKQNGEHRSHSRERSNQQPANNAAAHSKSKDLKQTHSQFNSDKYSGHSIGSDHPKKGHHNLHNNRDGSLQTNYNKHEKERHHRTKSSSRPAGHSEQPSSKHHNQQHHRSLSAGAQGATTHHQQHHHAKESSSTKGQSAQSNHVSPVKPTVSTAKADFSLSAATTKADSTTSAVVTSSSVNPKSIPTNTVNSQSTEESNTDPKFRSPLIKSPEKHKLPKQSLPSLAPASHQAKPTAKLPNGILPTLNGVIKNDAESKNKHHRPNISKLLVPKVRSSLVHVDVCLC